MKVKPALAELANPNANLYGLVQEAQSLILALVESKGEITPDLERRLAANTDGLAAKIDGYVFIEDHFEMNVALLKRKEDGLRAIRKGIENAQERLRGNIKAALNTLQKTELVGKEYAYKLGKRPSKAVIDDEKLIPQEFKIIVQSTNIDREKLMSALANGFAVPGAHMEEVQSLLVREVTGKD